MQVSKLRGEARKQSGTRDAWSMRNEGWIPAVLYGHGEANVHLRVRADDLEDLVVGGHHMIELEVAGRQPEHSLLKDIQYDAFSTKIIHVDFTRVSLDEVVTTSVPLHTHGSPKGLASGGILDILHHDVSVRGKARVLPEFLDVDIGELLIGQSLRVREIRVPEGVEVLLDPEEPVVIVHLPKLEAAPVAEGPAEPEVIGAKKPEEEAKPEEKK